MQKTERKSLRSAFFIGILSASSWAAAAVKIEVDPAVRAKLQWFWQEAAAKCVAVPTQDLITRIAPRIVREQNVISNKTDCRLTTGERRIEARLECAGKILQTFYLKEELCVANP